MSMYITLLNLPTQSRLQGINPALSIMFFSKVVVAATSSAGLVAAVSNSTATATSRNITVSMVRSAPPSWPSPLLNYDWTDSVLNICETVEAGISLIKKAAQDGARIITFLDCSFQGEMSYQHPDYFTS